MGLFKRWEERRERLGGTRGKPLWWLVAVLVLVLLVIYMLSQIQHSL